MEDLHGKVGLKEGELSEFLKATEDIEFKTAAMNRLKETFAFLGDIQKVLYFSVSFGVWYYVLNSS